MRVFKHYVSKQLVALGAFEAFVLALAAYVGFVLNGLRVHELDLWMPAFAVDIPMFVAAMTLGMVATGLYNREYGRDLADTVVRLAVSCVLAGVLLAIVFYINPITSIWRSSVAAALVIAVPLLMITRAIFLRFSSLEAMRRRVVVLGAGPKAARVEALIATRGKRNVECVGYIGADAESCAVTGGPVFFGLNSLRLFVREHAVDEVVVALEERRGQLPVGELLTCKMDGVAVVDFATFWERETGRVDLDSLSPSWLIFSDGFPGGAIQATLKRLFDVVTSLAMLIFSLPLMLITALAIRLESRGPVLYLQERVGLNGVPFKLVKFRSMRVDAEKDGVPQWASEADPRVTRVGSFIRKTRIDETPQLFNVLRGDMSIVGPRPERAYFVDALRHEVPYYFERHRVKPGISGWAQLNYPYGASTEDAKAKFQYDLYYLKNYSLFLDFVILLQTIRVIVWSEGAR